MILNMFKIRVGAWKQDVKGNFERIQIGVRQTGVDKVGEVAEWTVWI